MKKALSHFVFLVSFSIALPFFVLAQEQDLTVGFQLNPSISSIQFSSSSKFTFNVGLEVQERISDHFSIESGVHIFSRGFKDRSISIVDFNGNNNELIVELDRKMLTIPVTLMFNFRQFYIGAGPNINYVFFNQLVSMQGNTVEGQSDFITDGRSVFGAQFMLGYNFSVTERISIDLETYYNTTFEAFNFYNYGIGAGLKYNI